MFLGNSVVMLFIGKRRGRPRRNEQSPRTDKPKAPDKIDSAAEGLLELSNTGALTYLI